MESLLRYLAPPSQCGYLPQLTATLEYELVATMTAAEYAERMLAGWRRFGRALFRPRCQGCQRCVAIRVVVDSFRPDRSQRRNLQANDGQIRLFIRQPSVTQAKLALYDRYHAYQAAAKDWPAYPKKDVDSYGGSFVDHPFATEEWNYFLDDKLVGVGYVDALPCGLSAIYFIYDPQYRHYGLGTYNVLLLLRACARRRLPHLYLGYHVEGCASMAYKARFRPNELRKSDGSWEVFHD